MTEQTQRERYITKLNERVCDVVFTKVDGSARRMKCTLNHALIPNDQIPQGVDVNEPTDKKRKINEETVACFDVELGAWRSFRVDSVIDFVPTP